MARGGGGRGGDARREGHGTRERRAGRLSGYQARRDFTRSPEPAGTERQAQAGGPRRFVVHRHRARRLHYDLRLEIDGVLVSWAVPSGPTLDPAVRRLAVRVEDHPIEYLGFEGVIPAGEYGAGDVIVWDTGTWQPHGTDDPAAAVAAGELHADVAGHKLRGRLVLVRRGPSGAGTDQWLLLHKRDDEARPGWDPEDHPASVLSGRTNEEVAADPERIWRAGLPPAQASVPVRPRPVRGTAGRGTAGRGAAGRGAAGRDAAGGAAAGGETAGGGPGAEALAALGALGTGGRWEVFGRGLRLTNLDKELFPGRPGEQPVTKRELIAYTARIAPVVLPYLAGRPLHMHRFPGGADQPGFWHKQLPAHAPEWIPRWHDPDAGPGKTTTYLVADEPAALVWAANFGALEWHAWTARAAHPGSPTYALIDIDPGPATSWQDLLVLARLHRAALEHLRVRAAAKVTGRRGIQIWIPVTAGLSFRDTRAWVEGLSRTIGAVVPELVSWKWDVSERGGLARLDYTQNVHGKTLVAPYSPRAAAGAPVSAPIGWDELDDPALRPDGFTIRTVPARVAGRGDLFRPVLGEGQALPPLR